MSGCQELETVRGSGLDGIFKKEPKGDFVVIEQVCVLVAMVVTRTRTCDRSHIELHTHLVPKSSSCY